MTIDNQRDLSSGAGVLNTTSTVSGLAVAIRGVSVRLSPEAVGSPRSIRNKPPPTTVIAPTRAAQTSCARRETDRPRPARKSDLLDLPIKLVLELWNSTPRHVPPAGESTQSRGDIQIRPQFRGPLKRTAQKLSEFSP